MLGWPVIGAADFDGDAHSELVWQNVATRQATVLYLRGAQRTTRTSWGYHSANVPGWQVVDLDDFTKDDKPDLVRRKDTMRKVTV